jgi:hypothetical protein
LDLNHFYLNRDSREESKKEQGFVLKGDKCAFDLLIQSLLKGIDIVTLKNVAGDTK